MINGLTLARAMNGRNVAEDTWYGPNDAWPQHPKKHFRDALGYARAAGWHLREISGHSFSTVYCCRDAGDCCFYPVFSTGRAGESAADTLSKKVDACTHGPKPAPDATAKWVADVANRLDQVATMLTAAAECVAAESHAAAAYDLLDLISSEMTDVEELLDAVQAADEHAVEVATEVWTVIDAQVSGLPFPTTSAQVIEHVDGHLSKAEKDLTGPPSGQISELLELRARAGRQRTELDDLQAQLPAGSDDV